MEMFKTLFTCLCIVAATARSEGSYVPDNKGLKERLDTMATQYDERLEKLEAANSETRKARENLCQFKHNNRCFFGNFPSKRVRDTYQEDAKMLCAQSGAIPANIYSERHYDELVAYMRRSMSGAENHLVAWLGMVAHPVTGTVFLSDGTPAPYLVWYKAGSDIYPKFGPHEAIRTGMSVHIANRDGAPQGMFNYNPEFGNHGVICEFAFEY